MTGTNLGELPRNKNFPLTNLLLEMMIMKEIASILERKMMQRSLLLKMMSLSFLIIKELLKTTKSG
jgi:hypothetical protein